MKKVLICILCFVMTFSLMACGNKQQENNNSTQSNISITTPPTKPKEDTQINKPTEPIEYEPDVEFSYHMAPITKIYNEETGITTLWTVIEMKDNGWHLREVVEVKNTKTNENLMKLEKIDGENGVATVTQYWGCVCYDYTPEHLSGQCSGYEYGLSHQPVQIQYRGEINFDDIVVEATAFYKPRNDDKVYSGGLETYELTHNADITQITTNQKFIHAWNIFEIDDKYYLFNPGVWSTNSGNNGYRYTAGFGVIPITGTMSELKDAVENGVGFTYGKNAGESLAFTNTSTPKDYSVKISAEEAKGVIQSSLKFELKNNGEDEDSFKLFTKNIILRYTDKNGNDIVFCHN